MAIETFAFNISKGRGVEFFRRVKGNDPAASVIVQIPLKKGGTEAQGQDFDDVKALLESGNFEEQTGGGWERKPLTDSQLAAISPDDTNNRGVAPVPETNWGSPSTGNDIVGVLYAYDPDGGTGNDSELVPISCHAKEVKADGNKVTQEAGDVLRAS